MGRRKKVEEAIENPVPMAEDAMNSPIEDTQETTAPEPFGFPCRKKIVSPTSKVNVRDGIGGNVLFTLDKGTEVIVEEEKEGWCKITGYVMSDLVK